jgi:hypothetical protein
MLEEIKSISFKFPQLFAYKKRETNTHDIPEIMDADESNRDDSLNIMNSLPDKTDDPNNSDLLMKSYFEHQSEQQNGMEHEIDIVKPPEKKPKGCSHACSHRVEPITDSNKILQLYTKNGNSDAFFTRVGCKPRPNGDQSMIVPYCTPTMYYVCHECGMADQNGSKIEHHLNNDAHEGKKKFKNYIKLQEKPSKIQPRFGWYKGERYLVIEECRNAFACICGVTFEKYRGLKKHFEECTRTELVLATVSSGCVDLDGIVPIHLVNDKKHCVKFDTYSCGFGSRDRNGGVDDLEFCYNVPSKKMLTGQCKSTHPERKQYKIINCLRQIDAILNQNWIEISTLVRSKEDKEFYTEKDRNEWGAGGIQCERIEIGVTSEAVLGIQGEVLKTRGNECWKAIEEKYNIEESWMKDIVTYAKAMAQADTTKNGYTSYDSFSLILTDSDTTQQEHIDLLHPLSQYALTISNDVDTTIAYRVKKEITSVNSMISCCTQLSSELSADGTNAEKFKKVFKKIGDISSDSYVRQMIEKDGFGKLFQIRTTNKEKRNSKFERAYIQHAPTGTYTRIRGSEVHSGSGVVGRRVRGILFWSGKPLRIKNMYDPDVQQTMLSVMIEIIQEVWISGTHDYDLRREMVELMYHVYNLCGQNYKENGQGYNNAKIENMIKEFFNAKKSKTAIAKAIDDHAAMSDLFV